MNDTNSIVVTQHKIFTSLDQANAAGYFRPWQLKRRSLKPDGSKSRASLFDAVSPADMNDLERAIWLSSADLVWIGDKIGTHRRALYHLSCTKPYHPTDRTRAVWTYQDVFVGQWKKYRCCLAGQWCEVEAKEYRYGLNEAKIKEHLRGQEPCQVYAGRYTRFVAAHVQGEPIQQALAKAEEIKERLFASKWFCQVATEGITIYWLFKHRTKTEHVVARVRQCLGNVPATIGPTAKIAVDLPLSRGSLTFVDRLLPSVQSRKGPEGDVVGLADWMLGDAGNPDIQGQIQEKEEVENGYQRDLLSIAVQFAQDGRKNPSPADVLAAYQRQQGEGIHESEEAESGYQRDLLSIAVQFASGSLKHRFWRVITGFFEGRESLPLNTALLLSARILYFEGLPADTAKSILLDYCRSIPNPTSSRLTDSTRHHVLEKDIRRAVEGVYQDNGRQQESETSTQKLRAVVTAWRSKGLVFSDKTTWNLTYGYVAVPKVSFTEQERQNIKAYLLPLLSSRDMKAREPLEVAVHLADCIVRLVSAKEKQGTGIATSYLQQYIKGETGICCQNKTKFGKIKEALIALGFIKVLRQGRHRCGATYYGLAGRLVNGETPCENRTPVNEEKIDTIIMPIEDQVEECSHQRDLLSIAVQIPDSRPRRVLRLTGDPVFNRLLSQSQELQKPKPATLFTDDPVFNRLLAKNLVSNPPWS